MANVLTARDLLDLWERGLAGTPLERTLDLLASAYPDMPSRQIREMPIGRRDARLLAVREALFGPRLPCLTGCPGCGERLEVVFDSAQLRAGPEEATLAWTGSVTVGDTEVHFRLPNSEDLLQVAGLPGPTRARRALFERCVEHAARNGGPVPAADLTDEVVLAASVRMAELDPQADIQVALTCPACAHRWSAAFDIASYLWTEINAWAVRTLGEIHCLASAYGWREADILALSPVRRQLYLEMIG